MFGRKRSSGGYALAGHPEGELTSKEVNAIYDLGLILASGVAAEEMQIQRFRYYLAAEGTTNKTFTSTIDQCKVIGGYAKLSGLDADYDIDIGKTNDTDCFINDFNSGAFSPTTKVLPLDPTYLENGDDVIITVASNSNTGIVTIEVVLLTMHDTQVAPTYPITTTATLTKLDSGSEFFVDAAGGAYTITLPSVENGLNFKFTVQENTPTGDITIAAGSAIIYGNLAIQADTNEDNRVASAGVSNVLIDTTALKGDYVEFMCDGTSWYVSGMGSVQGAFTTS
ncbi:MAG: hypothetical protein H8D23_18355 [Candidatus Brocadiales bacterium]|nr:hypothetical protein [Candidatus Brocadiales bacterium]